MAGANVWRRSYFLGGVGGCVVQRLAVLWFFRGAAACGLKLIGEEIAETGQFERAETNVGAIGLADGRVVDFGFVVLVGDVANDGFEESSHGDETGDAAVTRR